MPITHVYAAVLSCDFCPDTLKFHASRETPQLEPFVARAGWHVLGSVNDVHVAVACPRCAPVVATTVESLALALDDALAKRHRTSPTITEPHP
jgi:hypothetical protein